MNISKRMPLAAVAVAIVAFGAGCLDQESPVSADRAVVRRAVLQETLACASGDRTLELQDAIERIKSAGGGTLKLWSKAECPAGYEYSTHHRNGQLVAHTNYQERLVLPWAQGGGWVEFPITAGTYDRLVIREWGWRYPAYTNYWDDPQSGAWVGVNELHLCSG